MIVFIYLERPMNLRKRVGIERGNRGRGKESREKTEELVFCLSSLWWVLGEETEEGRGF